MNSIATQIEQPGFWERQFVSERTPNQLTFDLLVGVGLPLFCLLLDPIVFHSTLGWEPILGRYCIVGYLATGIGVLSLSVWLHLKRPAALLAGLLSGGAIFAFLLGVIILPSTLLGLLFGIGILGFSPFLVSFVFLRNASRAMSQAQLQDGSFRYNIPIAVGLLVSCAGPWTAQAVVVSQLSKVERMLVSRDPARVNEGIATLKSWRLIADFDRLVFAYDLENDSTRKELLAKAYQELTGESIQSRIWILND